MVRRVAFLPPATGMPLKVLLLKSPYTSSKCTSVMKATEGEKAGCWAGGGVSSPQAVTTASSAALATRQPRERGGRIGSGSVVSKLTVGSR
jgi:hypothetical protein